ncbi:MAG: hypothetical protein Q8R82_11955 [Hyphomonadaceae bacterium]|nr:hypothetical protein [Hyphomonadaceae bacterium]
MDKSLGYWAEKFSGILLGVLTTFLTYKYWYDYSAITSEKYFDLIIKVSSSLFGFLLTLLGLIINSSSVAVAEMRLHKSFPRLIKYNKGAVFLSFAIILFSILMYLILQPPNGRLDFTSRYGDCIFKLLITIHNGVSVWALINITIFISIFYKIALSKKV